MENSTASNRKTGRMITKNLIVLVVLVLVVALTIWAWFAKQDEAIASGISVCALQPGVEVSWDGKDYYGELTARTEDGVIAGEVGPALSLYKFGRPSPLKLITGDGLNFFEPYINRRTGEVLTNSDELSWRGEVINEGNFAERYIDVDLYFRYDEEKTIYLAGDSKISPANLNNLSAYGDFSKDYISAATRVAFLNAEKTVCKFIWAPNADVELKENNAGYNLLQPETEGSLGNGANGTGGNLTVKHYELDDQATVALVNPYSLYAVSSNSANEYKKSAKFSDEAKTKIENSMITYNENFTVIKSGSGDNATYRFKSKDDKYLNVDSNGAVSFDNASTAFTLEYISGVSGSALKTNKDMYLVFSGSSFKAVTESGLNTSELVTVYTGSNYELVKNSSERQEYKYYDSNSGQVKSLSQTSTPPLFESKSNGSATEIIDKKSDGTMIPVAELQQNGNYYTAHIVMRIWVEGTDREAKTPLADGLFNTSFHFVSQ